ncbi:Calmodulin-binding transcription activator 1 [Camelus dromedarius]|uniref:Calmodulin-binding transcription activator 1 n=1 Tax=Camelus dromedarius TaxID=9838 RepID=A0A5N4DB92_CAMDR|nr:Calmodulin-binding transcription activator 1 [Camelus dromedarius]
MRRDAQRKLEGPRTLYQAIQRGTGVLSTLWATALCLKVESRDDDNQSHLVGVKCAENPDIVLVHYLNVPAIEDCGKPCGPILCSINTDKKEWAKWTKEELIGQLKPMCE